MRWGIKITEIEAILNRTNFNYDISLRVVFFKKKAYYISSIVSIISSFFSFLSKLDLDVKHRRDLVHVKSIFFIDTIL